MLLSSYNWSRINGHPVRQGDARENFVRYFLGDHHGEFVTFGSGEIFGPRSAVGESRNQHDIVVHDRAYPCIRLGGTSMFMINSVLATIEVKSKLTKSELTKAMTAAKKVKELDAEMMQDFNARWPKGVALSAIAGTKRPQHTKCFLVAYDGPSKMETLSDWLSESCLKCGIPNSHRDHPALMMHTVESPGLDGVYILGKGFVQFTNSPIRYVPDEFRTEHSTAKWEWVQLNRGALGVFFLNLLYATDHNLAFALDPIRYAKESFPASMQGLTDEAHGLTKQ